jgi:hypothetical protein
LRCSSALATTPAWARTRPTGRAGWPWSTGQGSVLLRHLRAGR